MSLEPVGSIGEENCLAIAVRLGWKLSLLGLATLDEGGGTLLGDDECLDGIGGS